MDRIDDTFASVFLLLSDMLPLMSCLFYIYVGFILTYIIFKLPGRKVLTRLSQTGMTQIDSTAQTDLRVNDHEELLIPYKVLFVSIFITCVRVRESVCALCMCECMRESVCQCVCECEYVRVCVCVNASMCESVRVCV